MSSSSPIRFAIVGAGRIGQRHLGIIERHPEGEVVALCDLLHKDALGLSGSALPLYHDLAQLLSEGPEFDVLCIASPNGLHASQAIMALKHGRHVLIEKPMALRRADCEQVIFEALHRSKQVFCVMQNRYSPPAIWLKGLLQSGQLGTIYRVQISCYWNRDDRYYTPGGWHGTKDLDGGTLFTQFSHFIDMLYWLFGDITDISSRFANVNHGHSTQFEDSGQVHFRLVNGGGMGSLDYSTAVWDKNLESSLTVIAEKGSIKISGQYMNEVVYCHVEGYHMPELPPSEPPYDYGPYQGSAANHHYIFQNVMDVLHGRDAIAINALEGLKVVDIIERMYGGA
ncbi:MAG: Gfo/Idh/MocA family oxidoreductase [Bacteroidia bacterium]|nr:Gfo/Idh/MocA family oxidoreductase [Bacteroidia bacterium]